DGHVTGVQTCALPISEQRHEERVGEREHDDADQELRGGPYEDGEALEPAVEPLLVEPCHVLERLSDALRPLRRRDEPEEARLERSEERRVGKEGRARV